jgi:hypothetical protein
MLVIGLPAIPSAFYPGTFLPNLTNTLVSPKDCHALIVGKYGRDGAQAHIARAAIQREAVNPGAGPAWANLQIEAAAIGVHSDFGVGANFGFSELIDKPRHGQLLVGSTHFPEHPYRSHHYIRGRCVQHGHYG